MTFDIDIFFNQAKRAGFALRRLALSLLLYLFIRTRLPQSSFSEALLSFVSLVHVVCRHEELLECTRDEQDTSAAPILRLDKLSSHKR